MRSRQAEMKSGHAEGQMEERRYKKKMKKPKRQRAGRSWHPPRCNDVVLISSMEALRR